MLRSIAWYTDPGTEHNIAEDENLWDFLALHQYSIGLHTQARPRTHTHTHTSHTHFFAVVFRPDSGPCSPLTELRDHTHWGHHTRQDSSGGVISPRQRPLSDKTQHLQETDSYAPGGIRTQNSRKRAGSEPRLRPRGHWDRVVS